MGEQVSDDRQQSPAATGAPVLAILGAGVMGETVLSGLVRAGWDVARIVATHKQLNLLFDKLCVCVIVRCAVVVCQLGFL